MDEQQLIRQQINEARRDFAIEDDLDFNMRSRGCRRRKNWRALGSAS
jgi:hypothetical protein